MYTCTYSFQMYFMSKLNACLSKPKKISKYSLLSVKHNTKNRTFICALSSFSLCIEDSLSEVREAWNRHKMVKVWQVFHSCEPYTRRIISPGNTLWEPYQSERIQGNIFLWSVSINGLVGPFKITRSLWQTKSYEKLCQFLIGNTDFAKFGWADYHSSGKWLHFEWAGLSVQLMPSYIITLNYTAKF